MAIIKKEAVIKDDWMLYLHDISHRLNEEFYKVNLDIHKYKLYGSILYKADRYKMNDIDLVTYDKDKEAIKKLRETTLFYKLHILPVKKEIFDDFENYQTYWNIAFSYSLDFKLNVSDNFIDNKKLVFNVNSLKIFNKITNIKKLTESLLKEGYIV